MRLSPLTRGVFTGVVASLFFTPIGGIAIGYLAYKLEGEKQCSN